jgi:hypothetical protein
LCKITKPQKDLKYLVKPELDPACDFTKTDVKKIRDGGSWDPEALEKIAGYDPEKQQKEREFFGKLQGAISDFQKTMQSTLKNSRKFGDGPPISGQWITKQDVELIPDVIKTFGDFKVVVKWNQRPRQIINAKDFHKHYDAITKDSEVKTGDYIKEVWVY